MSNNEWEPEDDRECPYCGSESVVVALRGRAARSDTPFCCMRCGKWFGDEDA